MFLTKTDGSQKMCDKNKNVTKMGMIIKGVYCIHIQCLIKTLFIIMDNAYTQHMWNQGSDVIITHIFSITTPINFPPTFTLTWFGFCLVVLRASHKAFSIFWQSIYSIFCTFSILAKLEKGRTLLLHVSWEFHWQMYPWEVHG